MKKILMISALALAINAQAVSFSWLSSKLTGDGTLPSF